MSALLAHRLSDERLGRRLAQGEAPAFDELYRRYVHRLAAYGTQLLGDGAAGDDVAQVALMRAYQALRAGQVPDRVRPWLYRIAHNAAIDLVRHRREQPTAALPEQEARAGDTPAGALMAAVGALPERQRRVFVLRELHGLRIDETAAELGLTAQQVEQSLFAARNRLAEQLVFGERLGCATVRKLAAGPLDLRERRALKTHVRSCPACRSDLGVRGIALSVLPLPSLQWLRGLAGGTPAIVKVGAVVATATVAAGVPLVASTHRTHARAHLSLGVREHGPDVPLSLLATQPGRVAPKPVQHRVSRSAPVHVAAQRAAPVFAVPVSSVAAPPSSQPATPAGASAPQPTPATPAATPAAPTVTTTTGGGSGGTTTPTTEPTQTTPTTTTEDGGGDSTTTTTDTTSSSDGGGDTTTTTDTSGSSSDGTGDTSTDSSTSGTDG